MPYGISGDRVYAQTSSSPNAGPATLALIFGAQMPYGISVLPGWGMGWVPPALRTDRSMAYPAVLQRDCPSPGQLRWPSSRSVAQRCLTASLGNGNMLTVGELGLLDRRAAPSSLAAPRTDGETEQRCLTASLGNNHTGLRTDQ